MIRVEPRASVHPGTSSQSKWFALGRLPATSNLKGHEIRNKHRDHPLCLGMRTSARLLVYRMTSPRYATLPHRRTHRHHASARTRNRRVAGARDTTHPRVLCSTNPASHCRHHSCTRYSRRSRVMSRFRHRVVPSCRHSVPPTLDAASGTCKIVTAHLRTFWSLVTDKDSLDTVFWHPGSMDFTPQF